MSVQEKNICTRKYLQRTRLPWTPSVVLLGTMMPWKPANPQLLVRTLTVPAKTMSKFHHEREEVRNKGRNILINQTRQAANQNPGNPATMTLTRESMPRWSSMTYIRELMTHIRVRKRSAWRSNHSCQRKATIQSPTSRRWKNTTIGCSLYCDIILNIPMLINVIAILIVYLPFPKTTTHCESCKFVFSNKLVLYTIKLLNQIHSSFPKLKTPWTMTIKVFLNLSWPGKFT